MSRQWLVSKRNSVNLTQQQVADMAGVKRAYYTQIENGTRSPSVSTAQRIARALKFDWTLFFAEDGSVSRHIGNVVSREEMAATKVG